MQERTLLDYWLILYERRLAICVVVLTSVASALIIGWIAPPVYEARAALYVPAELKGVSYVSGDSTSTLARQQNAPLAVEDAYKPYVGILKSLQLAQMVNAQYPSKRISKLLRSDTDFEVTDELIIRVYSRDSDPVLAANVANAYVAGLNQILSESSLAQVSQEPGNLKAAEQRVDGELKQAEADLKRYEEKHRIASLTTELNSLAAQKSALLDKQDENMVAVSSNRARQAALLDEFRREGEELEASEVATTTPLIENLRSQLAEQITKLGELRVELGKNNLTIVALEKRRDEIERQLKDEIGRWLTSRIKPGSSQLEKLRQQLIDNVVAAQTLEATGKAYAKSIARLNERVLPYPEIKNRWSELNQNVERLRNTLRQIRVNLTEARLQTDRQMQLIVQLERAEPPGVPAFPIWWLNLLVALLGGLLAGIGYAFFLNYVDETRDVRTLRLVRAILGPNANAPVSPAG
jgi:uncharacterized protein involved in exopolysaccharide biosynthesis